MSLIIFDLKNDYRTKIFPESISKSIFEQLSIKYCKFCYADLDNTKASYYQHSEGFTINIIKQKIWIWFTCKKCKHQWSINYLGIKRNQIINI